MMTRRYLSAILLALALAPPAGAAAPKAVVEGSLTRKTNQSILLDARKSASDKPLQWKLISPAGGPFLTFDAAPRKNTYFFIPDPEDGVYVVSLVAVGKVDDELEADVAVVQVVVGAPAPTPPPPGPTPDPQPGPGPAPVPPAEKLFLSLVYDLDASDPAIAVIRSSPAIRTAEAELNFDWRDYDDDAAAVKARNLTPYVAQAGGVPALIVQSKAGDVLASVKCPNTVEGVMAILKQYRKVTAGGAR